MKIFEFSDYREYLRQRVRNQDKITFAWVAAQARMQRPAFSKVMNGAVDLSSDQVFLIAEALSLSPDEAAYFELLVERERSGLSARKDAISEKIRKIQNRQVKTPTEIATSDTTFQSDADRVAYFTNPWAPLAHIFLTIPAYQAEPQKILRHLDISKGELTAILELLRRMGVVKKTNKGAWVTSEASVHSQDFALPTVQQLLFRAVQLQRLSVIPLSERYGLSVAFSSDEQTHEEARQILVKAVTKIHGLVSASPSKAVYHLNVDLFPWEKRE